MGKFVWKDNIVVDFGNGVSFEVSGNEDSIKDHMLDVNNRLLKSVEQNRSDYNAVINAVLDAIDELMGDGATGRIFAGHALSARNVLGAYLFIVNEILSQSCEHDEQVKDLMEMLKKPGNSAVQEDAAVREDLKREVFNNAAALGVNIGSVPTAKPRL